MDNLLPRPFGKTEIAVAPVCIGTSGLASMPNVFGYEVSEERAVDTVRAALRSPLNFMDTAAGYGDGESERRIGIALRELGGLPEGYVLATKIDPDRETRDFSGAQAQRSVERSMKLLGLDYLQIVHLHDPEVSTFDNLMQSGGAVDELLRYQREGVIGYLGVAGGPIELLMRYLETGAFDVVLTHNRYTLLNRAAEPLIQLAQAWGIVVLNAAPYGGGMLSKGPDAFPKYAYRVADEITLERAQKLQAICNAHNIPLSAAALQFSLRDPRITSTVVGVTRPERIAGTIADAQLAIPAGVWEEFDAVGYERRDL